MNGFVSRRGFFARGFAFTGTMVGGSFIGRLAARPLETKLPAMRKLSKPRSAVKVSAAVAKDREAVAKTLGEFQMLSGEAATRGLARQGVVGADGVSGYMTEGARSVAVVYGKTDGHPNDGAVLGVRWAGEAPPEVNLVTIQHDTNGNRFVHRSYVEDGMIKLDSTIRDLECIDVGPYDDCICWHYHIPPHDYCPPECPQDAPCVHATVPRDFCEGCYFDEECYIYCSIPCIALPSPWNAACLATCAVACQRCAIWCCDYMDVLSCAPPSREVAGVGGGR